LPVPMISRDVNSRSAIFSFEGLSDMPIRYRGLKNCHPERSEAPRPLSLRMTRMRR
jgi:hypothetical protein